MIVKIGCGSGATGAFPPAEVWLAHEVPLSFICPLSENEDQIIGGCNSMLKLLTVALKSKIGKSTVNKDYTRKRFQTLQ